MIPRLFPKALDPANPLYDTDSYKYSHPRQYPEDATRVSAYVEPRRGWEGLNEIVFFGLQIELAKLQGAVVTEAHIEEAAPFLKAHGLELYVEGWRHIVETHGGRLPICVKALPEGTVSGPGVPQMRIENTDPACAWLPGFLETRLLRAIWYPSTVASLSRHVVGEIRQRMLITDATDEGVEFKLHDFGARGATSFEAAAAGGAAHLISARGTDTVAGLILARNVYGAEMAGFSIPATEHSTVTSFGREGELAFMDRLLDQFPTGLVACVSDSYDLMNAVRNYWGGALREKVLARDGVLVVRPDSGDPVKIVPEVIEALMERFGFSLTPTGYRLLNPKVRVIQGDGVNRFSIVEIMQEMMRRKLAIGNIAFGMGGGLLQNVNRDNFSYSMKVSAIQRGGIWEDVFKDPITAQGGSKTSKRGRQGAIREEGALVARRKEEIPKGRDALEPVFENGELLRLWSFDDIRQRAAAGLTIE